MKAKKKILNSDNYCNVSRIHIQPTTRMTTRAIKQMNVIIHANTTNDKI